MEPQPPSLSPDRALVDPIDDRLGYGPFAKQLARGIMHGCPADGLVVALYGPWGSGKSTVLNFILHYVNESPDEDPAIVVRFNPWWFAGHEDLVRRFFKQFEAALFKAKARKRSLLKKLSAFSAVVSELPIEHVGTAGKVTKAALAAMSKPDVVELKAELVAELARDATRIIVVMDDVDRLEADEIRQLFQVVKAVADFPNVIYLMAFDRGVVVKALERSSAIDGEDYLEKIIQVPFTLPHPDRTQLQSLLFEHLDRLLSRTPAELFDQQHWGNVYIDGVDPFVRKPRDVVRLVNALNVTYGAVVGEVNAVDFVAIETLRVFAPAAYEVVRANADMFTGVGDRFGSSRERRDEVRAFHDGLLASLGDDRAVVQKLLKRLFPRLEGVWGNTSYGDGSLVGWRKQRRVCSPDVFPVFFRLALPEGDVSTAFVRRVIAEAADAERLSEHLLSLARERRADGHTRASSLLDRLNDHAEKDIPEGAVVPMLTALFRVGDDVVRAGKRESSLFDLGDNYRLGWVIRKLLRRIPLDQRGTVLRSIFSNEPSLFTMARQLTSLGEQHGEWNGEAVAEEKRLLAGADVDDLVQILLPRIRATGQDGSIWSSVSPTVLLDAWGLWGDRAEMRLAVAAHLQDDGELLKFVRRFATKMSSHGMTDRVARVSMKFDPQRLADFVDVDAIAQRVEAMHKSGTVDDASRDLVAAFLNGRKARQAGRDPLWGHDDDDE